MQFVEKPRRLLPKSQDEMVLIKIKLKFSPTRILYITTKPLHSSQRLYKEDEERRTVIIEVVPNRELIQLILSFGPDVEVMEPQTLREQIIEIIEKMQLNY